SACREPAPTVIPEAFWFIQVPRWVAPTCEHCGSSCAHSRLFWNEPSQHCLSSSRCWLWIHRPVWRPTSSCRQSICEPEFRALSFLPRTWSYSQGTIGKNVALVGHQRNTASTSGWCKQKSIRGARLFYTCS